MAVSAPLAHGVHHIRHGDRLGRIDGRFVRDLLRDLGLPLAQGGALQEFDGTAGCEILLTGHAGDADRGLREITQIAQAEGIALRRDDDHLVAGKHDIPGCADISRPGEACS